MKKNILTHVGIIVIIFVTACIFFSPALSGKVIRQGDIQKSEAMGHAQKLYAEQTGESIPNWNPAMFSGMPGYQTAIEPQHSIFTPLKSLLIMRPLGLERNIGIIFLYLLGFYIALIAFGLNPWLALVGALAFGLGSYNIIIIEAGHITKAWAMSMMAPILAGMFLTLQGAKGLKEANKQCDARRAACGKIVWGSILFCLALGLQITFNHIQITFYTAIACVLMGVVYFFYSVAQRWFGKLMLAVGVLVVAAGLAFACNVRHLMVNKEYSDKTMRGGGEITVTAKDLYHDNEARPTANASEGLDRDYAFSWSYGVGETYTLLVPGARGGGSIEPVSKSSASYNNFHQEKMPLYWGDQPFTSGPVYFGAIVIFLFILGLIVVKGPERWWILAATLLAIVMSWGKNLMGFNGWLFDNLPLYNKFRTPSMSLTLANVLMVLLGFLGLKEVTDKDSDFKRNLKAVWIAAGVTVGILLVGIITAGSLPFTGAGDNEMSAQYGEQWQQIFSILRQDREHLYVSDSWRSILFVILSVALLWLYLKKRAAKGKSATAIVLLIGLLTVIDLWGVDRRYLSEENFVAKRQVELHPDQWDYDINQQAAQFGDEDFRVLNLAVNTFNDSKPSAFHNQIGGYSAAKLRRYQDVIDFYISRHINMNVLNMLNTRYVVVQGGQVQRNPEALGNCWFVNQVKAVDNANDEIMALNELDPKTTAVVNTVLFPLQATEFANDSADWIRREHQKVSNPDYLQYTSHSASQRLAVFSEIYYAADWRAYIDGKPADYIQANYILRAMIIPAGDHTIEFRNEAPLLHKMDTLSLIFSIVLLLAIAGALVLYYRKPKCSSKPCTPAHSNKSVNNAQ